MAKNRTLRGWAFSPLADRKEPGASFRQELPGSPCAVRARLTLPSLQVPGEDGWTPAPRKSGARDVPIAAPATEEVPVQTWFLAAKPEAEQLRGSVAPGLPYSQLSGLREVGAQTTCGLDRPEAEKPQGNSHPCHSLSFVKANKSRN